MGDITDDDNQDAALLGASGIFVSGKYAYVTASEENGVEVLDVSNPSDPEHVGSVFDDDQLLKLKGACDIYVSGKYAYVASETDDGIQILDISNPHAPAPAGAIADDTEDENATELNNPKGIYVCGKYAYVASYHDHGVEILDIPGIDAPAASIGAISTDNLDVSGSAQIGNNLSVGGGLNVGSGGIKSDGPLAAEGPVSIGGGFEAQGRFSINDIMKLVPRESPPDDPENGYMYYDQTDSDAVCLYLQNSWVKIAGSGTCE